MMNIPSHRAFQALADQTRREILGMLREGPRTSGEIAARFDSSWPTISRHLGVLRDAGLVLAERQGQEIYYELNTSVFQDLVHQLMAWARPPVARPRRNLRRVTKPAARDETAGDMTWRVWRRGS